MPYVTEQKLLISHHCVQLYGETLLVNYCTRLCQVTTLYSLRHSVQDSCTCSQAWCSRCSNRHAAYYCCLLISLTVGLSAKRTPPNAPPRLPRLSRRRRQSHQNSSLFSGSPRSPVLAPSLSGANEVGAFSMLSEKFEVEFKGADLPVIPAGWSLSVWNARLPTF